MVEDQAKQLARSHAVVNAHDAKYFGPEYSAPEEPVIHIGDVHNKAESQPVPSSGSGMSPLVSGLIGAGLMATGVGGYIGFGMVTDAIKSIKPPTAAVAPVSGDGNTKYQLKLVP